MTDLSSGFNDWCNMQFSRPAAVVRCQGSDVITAIVIFYKDFIIIDLPHTNAHTHTHTHTHTQAHIYRVRSEVWKSGKSLDFIIRFSRSGKSFEKVLLLKKFGKSFEFRFFGRSSDVLHSCSASGRFECRDRRRAGDAWCSLHVRVSYSHFSATQARPVMPFIWPFFVTGARARL